MSCFSVLVLVASIFSGFGSAAAWFYASYIKVSREQVVAQRKKQAEKIGELPNLAGISLDGWDMSATFAAQSKWNARGAALAASSIGLQALGQILDHI